MIPTASGALPQKFVIREQPSHTYFMETDGEQIRSFADNIEAMRQAVYKIINTERYQYVIYSWNYGIETMDLYGKNISYVMSELKRRISEALLWDSRVASVDNFEFSVNGGEISCAFIVHTIFGDVNGEKVVNI